MIVIKKGKKLIFYLIQTLREFWDTLYNRTDY